MSKEFAITADEARIVEGVADVQDGDADTTREHDLGEGREAYERAMRLKAHVLFGDGAFANNG
jgi:hypothetical protein